MYANIYVIINKVKFKWRNGNIYIKVTYNILVYSRYLVCSAIRLKKISKMPRLSFDTNVPASQIPDDFLSSCTTLMSKTLGKNIAVSVVLNGWHKLINHKYYYYNLKDYFYLWNSTLHY